jgi:hypothetical protein
MDGCLGHRGGGVPDGRLVGRFPRQAGQHLGAGRSAGPDQEPVTVTVNQFGHREVEPRPRGTPPR